MAWVRDYCLSSATTHPCVQSSLELHLFWVLPILQYVSQVVIGAPYSITEDLIRNFKVSATSVYNYCSLVPRPPLFLILWFAFIILQLLSIILNTNRREKKIGNPGNEAIATLSEEKLTGKKIVYIHFFFQT